MSFNRQILKGSTIEILMGYWEEKEKYEETKKLAVHPINEFVAIINCSWCGAPLRLDKSSKRYIWFTCQEFHFFRTGKFLCDKCAKKCAECGRHFCPKHIENHGCTGEIGATCPHCNNYFTLLKKEKEKIGKNGKINVNCPHCKETIVVEK